ncbi:MAG: type I restriction endonuclease subunit R [Trichlorobacter sp.]|nr:type I restriction endonuclease subunit R [Trichlorobacter sp.]
MVSQTNEQALEAAVEVALTGTSREVLNHAVADPVVAYKACAHQGFVAGCSQNFDRAYAIDKEYFWQFLNTTQAKELEGFKQYNPQDWQRKILERFDRLVKKHGLLHLLKKGLKVDNAHFYLMYPAPLASSSAKVKENFEANIFSCTRQLYFSLTSNKSIDMVLFINGIPFVTIEFKNAWTGQTARYHGQKQYREDRDPKEPLLNFGRCLVHFAVDTDEAYMTTKLDGAKTFFLPFNKGYNFGQGNPPNPNGHKTAYLWEEIFTKYSLANIIQHFMRFDGDTSTPMAKRTLFFPRYHQLDVVRRLINHAENHGVGHTYLIQHSAGSGKSNSITWAAYQLIEAYPANTQVAANCGLETPLFDSVIVVTDRRILDKQLRDNIRDFSEVKNIVAPAHNSAQLKEALETGKKIIITTIQKFPFIVEGISDLGDKRFAVIIDEAHSSQSGSAHDNMNRAMGKQEAEEGSDAQDIMLEVMRSRKVRNNASYFAFTATPKNTTLEKFGVKQPDGSFKPFHLYSMKQAIEEGFILDVIANYTTYKSYYEIAKSITENPEFNTKKAQKKLRAFVEQSDQTITTKAEIMLEHFLTQVVAAKKLKNKGKGMVVTQNIESAIRYYQAIKRELENRGNPFKVVIAFSGKKEVDGIEYTEADMNGFSDDKTKDYFDTDDYRLLVVANKYLTGFDQPKLCAMYVDKKLSGVLCVQALSRLNRSAPKLNKRTEDLFVLDFFNTTDDIQHAFDPFYTSTSLSKATDINVLNDLKDALDNAAVYESHEIIEFSERYFKGVDGEQLSALIDTAVARFDYGLEFEHEQKVDFKIKAKQFVKIYGQMAAILPFEQMEWERLYWFLKFLVPKLKVADPESDAIDSLLESVDLSTYGLERVKLNYAIGLSDDDGELDPQNPNPRGGHVEEQKDPLDEIIRTFNERWFQGWSRTPEGQRVKFLNILQGIVEHPDLEEKYEQERDPHNRDLVFDRILQAVMLQCRREELELYRLYATDAEFKSSLSRGMQSLVAQRIYKQPRQITGYSYDY